MLVPHWPGLRRPGRGLCGSRRDLFCAVRLIQQICFVMYLKEMKMAVATSRVKMAVATKRAKTASPRKEMKRWQLPRFSFGQSGQSVRPEAWVASSSGSSGLGRASSSLRQCQLGLRHRTWAAVAARPRPVAPSAWPCSQVCERLLLPCARALLPSGLSAGALQGPASRCVHAGCALFSPVQRADP